jgi:hypothetical protein
MENSSEIKKQVDDLLKFCLKRENLFLKRNNLEEYKQTCMREFTDMHAKYPSLFFCIVENPTTFPYYRLSEMLQYKKKIEKEEISEQDASVEIGKKYFQEFVQTTVSNLDASNDTQVRK